MSIFSKKYDIEKEIALLHEELRTIEETKEFVKSKMWAKLKAMMLAKIQSYDTAIVTLAIHPDKNIEEIKSKHSLRTACKGLIEGIETTLNVEQEIKNKLKQLEETAELADLERTIS